MRGGETVSRGFIMPTGLLLMDDLEAAWPWQRANPTFSLLPRA
jgi:hypothetical protein